ncbi:hypothetical protein PVAND_000056 [Polypedilum vanderplanki]|uniref:Cytochrome P450 n=1 Tax=Polypedilum vanderplanki TaxID=319348 RepID=A0A9J6BJ65_POLVA|nr:hypothetical protein PVAND_000056 [Polypedilum vanderplanki]
MYGNILDKNHLVDVIDSFYNEYKKQAPAFGLYFFLSPAVVITDLNVIRDILIKDFDVFTNRGAYHNKESDPLSAQLLSLEDSEWKVLRHKLTPFFSNYKMKMIFRTLLNVSVQTIENLKLENDLQMIDAKDMFLKYTTDVMANIVYGIDMDSKNELSYKFRNMGSILFEYKTYTIFKALCMLYLEKVSKKFGLKLIPSDISEFFLGIVKTTVKYRLQNKIERKDVIDILLKIELENKDGVKLSIEEIAAQCFVFYLYGFETVACTGSFLLYNLAMHLEIQNKLRDEIKMVLWRHENKFTYEAVQEMNYLQMVIDETLRLYPPIFDIVRKSSRKYEIANSDLIIPSNTYVLIPIYSIHRDPDYYFEPEKFNPDRFIDRTKANLHSMAFIPFGSGNRNCIGSQFGLLKLKIALIQLLTNFKILPNEKTPNPLVFDPRKSILTSSTDMWLTFERLLENLELFFAMAWSSISIIFVTLILLLYRWIKKRYSFFKINKFPYVEPTFPFGNLKGAGSKYHANELFQKLYIELKHQGPACGVYFFLTPNVMITDLDVIRDVLIKNFDNFHNRGLYSNERDDPLSSNLFSLEDNEWQHTRMKLTPVFTSAKMKMMFNIIVDIANEMTDELKSKKSLEMIEARDTLIKFTIDVIGMVAFGLHWSAIKDPNSKFHEMALKVFKPDKNFFMKSFFLTTFKSLGRALRMKFFPADVSEFFMTTIKETVDYRLRNNVERNDFMSLMLKMYTEESDEKLTLNQLAAQCFLFTVAGFETSSSTSSFVLYNLAVHQDIQDKLRNDVMNIIAKNNNKVTYEAVNEMKYLQMVIDETLRLYGPVATIVRVSFKDYKILNSDLIIPKGTFTGIPTFAIHYDPEYYPEPEKFDPERFNDENKAKRHPMAFLPFGAGRRNCIGERFGLMQTKIAIIQLICNFKILPNEKTQIPMKFDPTVPTLSPLGGMWLKFEKLK